MRTAGGTEIIWQLSSLLIMQFEIQQNTPFPYAGYMDRPGPLGKFVENSRKLPCLEFSRYRIKNSTALQCLKLHITRGQKDLDAGAFCKYTQPEFKRPM
jgi:hypothetical protein